MKLKVVRRSECRFSRFYISATNGLVWSGKQWSENENKALLFADANLAKSDLGKLQALLDSEEAIRLRCVINITVHNADDFDLEQFQFFMSEASEFLLHYNTPRPAGIEMAIINSMIQWDRMKRLKDHK